MLIGTKLFRNTSLCPSFSLFPSSLIYPIYPVILLLLSSIFELVYDSPVGVLYLESARGGGLIISCFGKMPSSIADGVDICRYGRGNEGNLNAMAISAIVATTATRVMTMIKANEAPAV